MGAKWECIFFCFFHFVPLSELEMLTELQTMLSSNQGHELCGEGLCFDDNVEHGLTPVHNQEQSRFCLSTGTRRPSQAPAWHPEGVSLVPMVFAGCV